MRRLLAAGLMAGPLQAEPVALDDPGALADALGGTVARHGRGAWLVELAAEDGGYALTASPILCAPAPCRGLRLAGEIPGELPGLDDLQFWNATRPLIRAILDDQVGAARLVVDHYGPGGVEAEVLRSLARRLAADLDAFADVTESAPAGDEGGARDPLALPD